MDENAVNYTAEAFVFMVFIGIPRNQTCQSGFKTPLKTDLRRISFLREELLGITIISWSLPEADD